MASENPNDINHFKTIPIPCDNDLACSEGLCDTHRKKRMKVVMEGHEPDVKLECECGEQFWVTPCGEDNLIFNGKCLVAQCPKCGKIDGQ